MLHGVSGRSVRVIILARSFLRTLTFYSVKMSWISGFTKMLLRLYLHGALLPFTLSGGTRLYLRHVFINTHTHRHLVVELRAYAHYSYHFETDWPFSVVPFLLIISREAHGCGLPIVTLFRQFDLNNVVISRIITIPFSPSRNINFTLFLTGAGTHYCGAAVSWALGGSRNLTVLHRAAINCNEKRQFMSRRN